MKNKDEQIKLDKSVKYICPCDDSEKPVEFTHIQGEGEKGWEETEDAESPHLYDEVIYLGNCKEDGDLFACYHQSGNIFIIKGHLNSGKY